MFDNKNSSSDEKNKSPQSALPKLEDLPIHTMAQDLQNPNASASDMSSARESQSNKAPSQGQQDSPFLKTMGSAHFSSVQTSKNGASLPEKKIMAETSSSNSFLKFTAILIIILIFCGGAFYFIYTREVDIPGSFDSFSKDPSDIPALDEKITEEKKYFLTESPNYMMIDPEEINNASFKDFLKKTIREISDAGISSPVEFIPTDAQNNPLKFSEFISVADITLSESILTSLSDTDFSLFIFNAPDGTGIGLAIRSNDSASLKNTLLSEEPRLASQLETILIPDHQYSKTPFGNHLYHGQAIRYQNLISADRLAIDYAVTETHLLIATTKSAIEDLIDKKVLSFEPEELDF